MKTDTVFWWFFCSSSWVLAECCRHICSLLNGGKSKDYKQLDQGHIARLSQPGVSVLSPWHSVLLLNPPLGLVSETRYYKVLLYFQFPSYFLPSFFYKILCYIASIFWSSLSSPIPSWANKFLLVAASFITSNELHLPREHCQFLALTGYNAID